MSIQTQWLEQFTGLAVADGTALPGGTMEGDAAAYEQRRKRQQVMLAGVREQLLAFKRGFQEAMAQKIKKGKLKGQRLLKEDGTQLEEIEAVELSVADLAVDDESKNRIAQGAQLVTKLSIQLEEATIEVDGKTTPLFTQAELQAEFWTPLMRERILPETYIPDKYSETQRMIDESNKAYLAQVEQRKADGQLTPKMDRARMLMDSAVDVVNMTGTLLGGFAPGTQEFKIAQEVLNTTAVVLQQGAQVYDSVKARKYADAASTALEAMGGIVVASLSIGRSSDSDKTLAKAVGNCFTAGSVAIKAGAAFAQGIDGAEEGLNQFGAVLQNALLAAAALTTDEKAKEALRITAATAPAAFRQAALGLNIRQKIYDEDYAGIVQSLNKSAMNILVAVQKTQAEVAKRGLGKEAAAEVDKKFQEEANRIQSFSDTGAGALEMTVKMAIAAKRGEYIAGLNTLIDDIGGQLSSVLQMSGIDKAQADTIGQFYVAASSAPKMLACLTGKEFDVPGAMNHLSAGIMVAFKQADPGGGTLGKAGFGVAMALRGLSVGGKAVTKYNQKPVTPGQYGEAVELLITELKTGTKDVFDFTGLGDKEKDTPSDVDTAWKEGEIEEDDEEEDEEKEPTLTESTEAMLDKLNEKAKALADGKETAQDPKKALAELRRAAAMAKKKGKVAANLDKACKKLEAEQKEEAQQNAREEADELLSEANADLQELSDAQKFGAEASGIDKMIAKLLRDRMVLNLALQISQGGAAFLAKFVPALGAVAAGIKLAAQLHAAGLRAQQVYRWVQNQDDLEAAQSALSSSAANFVRNQGEQLAHYAAQATFAAAQLAAEITKLSGVAAPVGLGLQAAAETGAKLEEIIRRHARAEDLEAAWKITVKALRNPANRKLGLQARRLNPSLAKYSIAWGAVVAKDPLARNAMKACDLNEASLNDEASNVDKVVQYLETFYNEDLQLYRELDETPAWVGEDLELTLSGWTRLKRQSVTDGKLQTIETGKIDGLLARVDKLPEESPWAAADTAVSDYLKKLAKAKSETLPGATVVSPDNKPALAALAEVEADLNARARLFEQLANVFGTYVPQAQPEAKPETRDASVKAMNRAVKTLVKQAQTAQKAAETDKQRVTTQVQALS